MLNKCLVLFLAVLLPIQFNLFTILELKNAMAVEGQENSRKTFNGSNQRAGSAVIENTNVMGLKGSDVPAPVKDAVSQLPINQENLIFTERWASQAVMIGIALTGFIAVSACQGFSLDMLLFGAGALIYLAGEAITTFMYRGINKQEIDVTIEKGKTSLSDSQIDALKAQKENYQQVIAITKLKEMFQLAAGAVFFAAAVVSAVLTFKVQSGFAACLASASSSAVKLGAFCTASGEGEAATICSKECANPAVAVCTQCVARINGQIAAECSTCATAMTEYTAGLTFYQGLILAPAPGPSWDKLIPLRDLDLLTNKMYTSCLAAKTEHPECVGGFSAEAALAKTQKEIADLVNKKITDGTKKLQPPYVVSNDWIKQQQERVKKATEEELKKAVAKAEDTAKKTDDAAKTAGLAHGPVIAAETKAECDNATYMTEEEFHGCPGQVSIPGFVYDSPAELQKHNPWFKFLMNDVYAQPPKPQLEKFDPRGNSQSADANQERLSSIMGFSFVGIALVAGLITKAFASFFDLYLGLPYIRVILFGIVGGASLSTAAVSYAIEKTMEENIKKIDAIMGGFDRPKFSFKIPAPTRIPFDQLFVDLSSEMLGNAQLSQNSPFPCLKGDGKGNCIEMATNTLNDLTALGIDSETMAAAGLALKATDSTSGRTKAGKETFSNVSSLASMARSMRNRALDFRKLLNNKLSQAGQTPINFEEHERQFSSMVTKALREGGAQNPVFFASLSDGIKKEEGVSESSGKSNLEKDYAGLYKKSFVPRPAANAQGDVLLNANYEYQGTNQDQELSQLTKEHSYEIKKDDIVEIQNEDLFKMITIRYFKSAYPVFFREEK